MMTQLLGVVLQAIGVDFVPKQRQAAGGDSRKGRKDGPSPIAFYQYLSLPEHRRQFLSVPESK